LYDEPVAHAKEAGPQAGLFENSQSKPKRIRRDVITDDGLTHFKSAYPNENITKEDVFYYIYTYHSFADSMMNAGWLQSPTICACLMLTANLLHARILTNLSASSAQLKLIGQHLIEVGFREN
jgi:hypothetical protein